MEIILLENILNLGNIGDKVKVKNGYGRNYLLKQGKALRFNKSNEDSLDTVELVMAFEEEFGSEISDSEAEKILTVGDAIKFIESKSSQ